MKMSTPNAGTRVAGTGAIGIDDFCRDAIGDRTIRIFDLDFDPIGARGLARRFRDDSGRGLSLSAR